MTVNMNDWPTHLVLWSGFYWFRFWTLFTKRHIYSTSFQNVLELCGINYPKYTFFMDQAHFWNSKYLTWLEVLSSELCIPKSKNRQPHLTKNWECFFVNLKKKKRIYIYSFIYIYIFTWSSDVLFSEDSKSDKLSVWKRKKKKPLWAHTPVVLIRFNYTSWL